MPEMLFLPVSRVLTSTEAALFSYTGSERQAVALARVIHLPEDATYDQIEYAVEVTFVKMLEQMHGPAQVEYLGGLRRDTLRGKA
jgi:hypothetical protein